MSEVPALSLNNGTTIPQIGFGTLNVPPEREPTAANTAKTAEIVGLALEAGYRHIDTAQMYGNERGVGVAIASSGIPRDELYITSKLSNAFHKPDDVRRSFDETLEKLGLEQLDLFLIHWPLPTRYDGNYVATWQTMVELVEGGRLRSAGVSNFQPAHLDRIISATGVAPAVNQIELHPYFLNGVADAASAAHGVVVESWSPLGRGKLLDDPMIGRIAAGHGKTSAQALLRWHIQRGYVVIPKSMHLDRIKENFDVFDFELSADEMASIAKLDQGAAGRIGPDPDVFDMVRPEEFGRSLYSRGMKFRASIDSHGKTATGIRVPDEVVEGLASGKRPPVKVTINGYTYRSSVAVMGGEYLVGVSAANREGAGVKAGDVVDIEMELDTEPREVVVPDDFAAALDKDPEAKAFFEKLAYSHKSRHVLAIEGAKAAETRARRIESAVKMLHEGKA